MDNNNSNHIQRVLYIDEVFSLYSQRLRFTLLRYKIADENIVDDVISVAFIKLYEKYDEIDHSISVWPYLFKIAIGIAQNEKRKSYGREYITFDGDIEKAIEDSTNNIVDSIAFKQGIMKLKKKLSKKDWEVFVDNYVNELTHKEISEKHSISEASSRNKKKRLAKKLRGLDWKKFF